MASGASGNSHRLQKLTENSIDYLETSTIPDNLSLLNAPTGWDVLAVVGAVKKEYQLHETIIAAQGEYFAAATWRKLLEGRNRRMVFEEFEPEATFEEVSG
ncbi:hypothetical protein TWF718_009657 [Orbilia javanica]|uniref:Uncharacterized protein n=1 Tax=Orbilia javanica TaxID=47235 RepID=A0AAN8RLL1_9PEZI